eukprot:m.263656 g.263656  ORF g.263656 m.263656 type:complete len:440 (+) comp51514_c0_seq1:109-1428(+)
MQIYSTMFMPVFWVVINLSLVASASGRRRQAGEITWPPGPRITCVWNSEAKTLDLSWNATVAPMPTPYPADAYEIGIARSPDSHPMAVQLAGGTNASLGMDTVLPDTTYYISARAHAAWAFVSGRAFGVSTFGHVGPISTCSIPSLEDKKQEATPQQSDQAAHSSASAVDAAEQFTFEVWRLSEFTTNVDYLGNHDSADRAGSSLLLTVLAQYVALVGELPLHDSWLGSSSSDAVITTYCVDALKPPVPGNVTTRGSVNFADYLSCNNQADKSLPNCTCAVAADRQWGRVALKPSCHLGPTKLPCPTSGANCECDCSDRGSSLSAQYTGMIPVFAADDEDSTPIGKWYSHPLRAECSGKQPLGSQKQDGTICTWKLRPHARVMRGWQLYSAGLNSTNMNCNPTAGIGANCSPNATLVRENAAVMESVLSSAPLQPWSCE